MLDDHKSSVDWELVSFTHTKRSEVFGLHGTWSVCDMIEKDGKNFLGQECGENVPDRDTLLRTAPPFVFRLAAVRHLVLRTKTVMVVLREGD